MSDVGIGSHAVTRDRPVVLLHGLATNASRTSRETGFVDLLEDSGRLVVAPDLPGHRGPHEPVDPAAYSDFEAQVLAELPEGPLDAVGFSLGARTLLVLAAEHPERFGRLVVAGVGANLFRRDGASRALADLLDPPPEVEVEVEVEASEHVPTAHHFLRLSAAIGQDVRALAALLRRPDPPEITPELLARIPHPAGGVLGGAASAGPVEPLADALADPTVSVLRGGDHFATPKAMGFVDAALRHLGC